MRPFFRTSSALAMAALLTAGGAARSQTPAPGTAQQEIRYEPAGPNQLPIQSCEIKSEIVAKPYTVQLPVKVKIFVWDNRAFKDLGGVFNGVLDKPMKLDPGYYRIEVEGQKDPIHVAYGLKPEVDAFQFYNLYKAEDRTLIGPFVIPGLVVLPVARYIVQGAGFELLVDCRFKERAVFHGTRYETLPPFLEPAEGLAW